MADKRTVYVVGHRNPDTDSICSAIAYSRLKNALGGGNSYVATRAGQINAETEYVLSRFSADIPVYLNNIGTRVKDMEIRKVPGVDRGLSLKKAWELMDEINAVTLPIVSEDNKLEGIITIQDIATSMMRRQDSSILSAGHTPYKNIIETLDGEMIVGDENADFNSGKVIIAAANPDVMEHYIKPNDMVILGNRYESQLSAIEMEAGCIVICLGAPVSKSIRNLAAANNCCVIVTPLDTYEVARLINQSMTVGFFMKSDNLITFDPYDYTDDIKEEMMKRRFRDFPIVDKKKGTYVGMISRRNLLGAHKRAVILVDHNEEAQAVDNIRNADILEVIDHHRLGSLETFAPVYFRNEPVGSTATIIYKIYKEKGVEVSPDTAGLMCGAVLSDTLLFRSPTCTEADKTAAYELARTAGIDCEKFGVEMFTAGSNLIEKTPEEIFYQDYKKFEVGKITLGVGQINSMSEKELSAIKEKMLNYVAKTCSEHRLDMVFFMLTDIITESTELICYGDGADELCKEAFGKTPVNGCLTLGGVVSRKKQLIPAFMSAINNEGIV